MKTYLLRDPKTVEPQKHRPHPLRAGPGRQATVPTIRGRPAARAAGPALFLGLDVHNDSIAVSLAPSDSSEVRRYGIIGGAHDDVLKLIQKLQAAHPGVGLKFCYEAGPRGYPAITMTHERHRHPACHSAQVGAPFRHRSFVTMGNRLVRPKQCNRAPRRSAIPPTGNAASIARKITPNRRAPCPIRQRQPFPRCSDPPRCGTREH